MRRAVSSTVVCLLGFLASAVVHAQEPAKYTLRFSPELGTKCAAELTGLLLDASFQGQSLGVNGDVAASLLTETMTRDDEAQTTTIRLALEKVRANLNGQITAPASPPPLLIAVGRRGDVTDVKSEDPSTAEFGLLDTGGVPVVMVAMLATTIRFPEQPVSVDEEWESEQTYQVPGLGEVPIETRWQLVSMQEGRATVTSTATAALPDFRTPNPMVPGTEMDVRSGRAYLTELKQEYDTATSHLVTSEGKLRIDAQLEMQGMIVPVSLSMSFAVRPEEKADESAP
jgi:hypothetical protein